MSEKLNSHRRKRSKTALKSTKNNFVRKNAKNRGFGNVLINSRLRNNAFRCPVTRLAKWPISHSDMAFFGMRKRLFRKSSACFRLCRLCKTGFLRGRRGSGFFQNEKNEMLNPMRRM